MATTKETPSKPSRQSGAEKVAATDSAARTIIKAETGLRDKKTERLKALRLAHEAEQAATMVPPAPKKIKKTK